MTNFDAGIIVGAFIGLVLILLFIVIALVFSNSIKKQKEKIYKSEFNLGLMKVELEAMERQSSKINEINAKRFNYLNSIFSSIRNGLILLDNNGEILFMNPQAQGIFEVNDQVFFDSTLLKENALYIKINNMIQNVKLSGKSTTRSIAYKDNFYELYISKIFDKYSSELPLGILMSVRDVTEQMKVEKLRKDFVQNVSHEFRTPLTVIASYLETIKMWDDLDHSYKQDAFNIIEFEIDRLKKILNQLLDITNLDHQYEKEPVSLSALIKTITPSYSRVALMNDVTFEVVNRINGDDTILVNRSLFLQAISNVIENAIKYTRLNTSIVLEMSSKGDSLLIAVHDEGLGISNEDQYKIFERFYRVDKHRNSKTGGSGLGLAITKEVIESLDGKITVESRLNRGSKFTIIMPKFKEKR